MGLLKQSTAYSRQVLMIDSTDHITGKTGLTLTITASKAGAAFASISPTVTELATGWYKVALTTSHTDTLGDLCLHITASGADATDTHDQIIAADLADAVRLGLSGLPNAAAGSSGGVPVVGTQLPAALSSNGFVKSDVEDWKNATAPNMSGDAYARIGAPVGVSLSQDLVTNTGYLQTIINATIIRTNVSQAGTSTTIQLDVGASSANGAYVGCVLMQQGHARVITGYVGLTKVATVDRAWAVDPTTTTYYLLSHQAAALTSSALAGVDLTQAVPTTNTAHTMADCLNAARAQGFGKWVQSGTSLVLYASDGTTVVRTFTLDSATEPTSRT